MNIKSVVVYLDYVTFAMNHKVTLDVTSGTFCDVLGVEKHSPLPVKLVLYKNTYSL